MQKQSTQRDKRALRAVAAQFVINGMVAGAYIPRLPEIRDSLNLDLSAIGQLITAASIGGLLGSWLCSYFLKYFSTKTVLINGCFAFIVLLPCIALASSGIALALVLALILFVDVIVDIAVNMQGSNLSARRHKPVMNRLHGLWSIGMVTGGLIASIMAAYAIPLIWHLTSLSLLIFICLIYVGKGLLNDDEQPLSTQQSTLQATSKTRRLWLFAILGGCAFIPEMALSDWSPFRLKDDLLASEGLASLAYVCFGSGMVFGRLLGDWVVAKIGMGKLLHCSITTAMLGGALACIGSSITITYLGLVIAGLGIAVLFPTLYDAAAQDKQRPGAMLGAMAAGSRLAALIAPLGIGILANAPSLSVGLAIAMFAAPCLILIWVLYNKLTG
ncbi:MAG: MFS transporter [Oceanospirillaceae bacterium]